MKDMAECLGNTNVLYICVSGTGGSNQALLSTLIELKARGVTPLIIVPDTNTAEFFRTYTFESKVIYMRQEIRHYCNSVKEFFQYIPLFLFNYAINIIAYIRLKRVCISFNPDVIHSNVTVTSIGSRLAKKYNIPHIWHIREYVQRPMMGKKRLTKSLNNSNTIIVTKGLQDYYKINNLHCRVIYDGINHSDDMNICTEIPSFRYFISVGRITKAKGIDILIDSFILFARMDKSIDLLLVGDGKLEYINRVKEKLRSHGLLDRVHFAGYKKHNETMFYMRNAEALIVSSLSEGFGLITAEAMFNKCLVIGNNNTGTKEQLDNGLCMTGKEIGLRFNNAEELLMAMLEVSSKGKTFFQEMINNAYYVVNSLYTVSKNGSEVLDYYKSIIYVNKCIKS